MSFTVFISEDAEDDIEDILDYVATADSPAQAERLLSALEETCLGLSEFPERGNVPKELRDLGLADYREAYYKPYRIIYRVMQRRVVVYAVVDGRRDMQTLLQRRMLRWSARARD